MFRFDRSSQAREGLAAAGNAESTATNAEKSMGWWLRELCLPSGGGPANGGGLWTGSEAQVLVGRNQQNRNRHE